ncbi:phosphatase PAP2 family protein [Aidingimonas halophila]|uniref:undecaprenyl-diphosphate phosphatase n=1 Tax=Aidingimonas halophila TaxID=574349 RepID=A0A1H3BVY2_9GAMM|nr:phosphatase PAP2 family protein [Aidingimonas halophila]GHC27223.1 phosphatase PAP2 family protein [Aidingimonas halophila]SDX45885.1 undecaprenyl-diphosphatase [Aidingimonas halophila]
MTPRIPAVFERLDALEWQLCQRLAKTGSQRRYLMVLRVASRLGDWPLWVALILAQPLWHGPAGWQLSVHFTLSALVAIGIYRLIKTRACRERPSITYRTIPCTTAARDRYSFPSGHTLHAVMFSLFTAATAPMVLIVILPLACLIAMSRVGLGLHYISDVIGGAMLGATLAIVALTWLPAI